MPSIKGRFALRISWQHHINQCNRAGIQGQGSHEDAKSYGRLKIKVFLGFGSVLREFHPKSGYHGRATLPFNQELPSWNVEVKILRSRTF